MAYVGAGYVLAELETEQAAQILQQLKLEDAAYILAPRSMAWPP
jgi:flagellar motility protein MotE (MotC chaperone)